MYSLSFLDCSKAGLWLIQQFESYQRFPYEDGAGNLTIGYGHEIPKRDFENDVVLKKEGITERSAHETGINLSEAYAILVKDLQVKTNLRAVSVSLEQHQIDALQSLCFNIGINNFKNSTLVKNVNALDFMGAADSFGEWRDIDQEPSRGLRKRRLVETMVFLNMPFTQHGGLPSQQVRKNISKSVLMPFTDENWNALETNLVEEALELYAGYVAKGGSNAS